jgi:NADH pyrophosphatase NudC (nudix superfamily)
MPDHCPGAANLRTPTLAIKRCPNCGEEVELFSNDVSVKCSNCGFEVYNDIASCVQWCRYAKECVGTELYNRLMAQKDAVSKKE